MSEVVVVLDACALFPASLRDILLRAAMRGLYRPQWSDRILDELLRNLQEDRGLSEEQARRLVMAMSTHCTEATVSGYEGLMPMLTCHEKDRHVLAVAIHVRAAAIVTFNLRDFPLDSLAPYTIEAQHPDTFILQLFERAPDMMVTLLQEQAVALKRPPSSVDRVLDTLGQHVPVFVSRVRGYLILQQDRDLYCTGPEPG